VKEETIIFTLMRTMSSPRWGTYQGLFDKYLSRNIRNLMYDANKVACLFSLENDMPAAQKKVQEYKDLELKEHYKINYDFF
jgi:hypothetical protein